MVVVGFVNCDVSKEHEKAVELRDNLLTHFLGVSDPAQYVFYKEKGRPCLKIEGADISVSHSSGTVAVALSLPEGASIEKESILGLAGLVRFDVAATSIGIDLEVLDGKAADRCKKLACRRFTSGEQKTVNTAADPVDAFVKLWTEKESLCKLSGAGLSGLKDADTENLPDGVQMLNSRIELGGKQYYFSLCYKK